MLYAITYGENVLIESGWIIGAVCAILAVIIAFYVLRSIGLYKMAENSGVKRAWIAFIPFGWIFTAGKIIGTAKIFGRPFKNFALITFVLFTVSQTLTIIDFALSIVPLIGFYLGGGQIVIGEVVASSGLVSYPLWSGVYTVGEIFGQFKNGTVIEYFKNPTFLNIYSMAVSPIMYISELGSMFFMITLYSEICKKYCPRRYFLLALVSFFGGFAIVVFVLRNRKAINYSDYIREQYAKMYGANYTNPYGTPNTESGASQAQTRNTEPEPEEPFAEFSKKNNKDN